MAVQQSPIYIKPNTSGLPIVGAQPGNGLSVDATNRLLLVAATTGDGGAMSAADKTKLDAVTVPNIPTADEKAALAGTGGTPPSTSNPYTERSYVDAAVNAVSGEYGAPVQTIAALRAVAYGSTPDKQLRLVEDVGALFRYDSAGTGADDGVGTILPTGNTGAGRWYKVQAATQDHEALVGLLGGASSDHQHLTTAQLGQLPSSGEKSALAGTSGTPGSGNKFVTDGDPRNTNARAPTSHTHVGGDVTSQVSSAAAADAVPWTGVTGKPSTFAPSTHASSHVGGGSDAIATAVAAGAAGLLSGSDKSKLDGIASGANNYSLPDATVSVTGGVRLTGDLGGPATAPTVPGLAAKAPLASPPFTGLPNNTVSSGWGTSTNRGFDMKHSSDGSGDVFAETGLGAWSWLSQGTIVAQVEAVRENPGGGYPSAIVIRTHNGTSLVERLRITPDGNILIKNTAAAPGSNPTGGGYFYVESGALKYRGSSGTVTTIAPA